MSSHEITFNTNFLDSIKTQADFTYTITPTLISIADTGLGKCSVLDDIEAVLRKIEHWHQGPIAAFKIMSGMEKDSGTKFTGTAKTRLCLLWVKQTNRLPKRSSSIKGARRLPLTGF